MAQLELELAKLTKLVESNPAPVIQPHKRASFTVPQNAKSSFVEDILASQQEAQKNGEAVSSRPTPSSGALHAAAKKGDVDQLKRQVQFGFDVNQRFTEDNTPLHWAAWSGSKGCCDVLLLFKADVNATNEHGYTPLHWAAMLDRQAAVTTLLANNTDVEMKDAHGAGPLHWAVSGGSLGCAEQLVRAKANVNALNKNGETPLHWAITETPLLPNRLDMIGLLCANGADLNAKAQIEGSGPHVNALQAAKAGGDESIIAAIEVCLFNW